MLTERKQDPGDKIQEVTTLSDVGRELWKTGTIQSKFRRASQGTAYSSQLGVFNDLWRQKDASLDDLMRQ
jgi:hypothetical protein